MSHLIKKQSIGQVTSETATIIYIDVRVGEYDEISPEADEYVIRLNGRVIKRIHPFQAQRTYGLFSSPPGI